MTPEVIQYSKDNYYMAFYAIALLFSVIRYRKYFDSLLKFFPIIIAYTLISELIGMFIRDYDNIQLVYLDGYSYYNHLVFNILDIVFFLYFFYVFYKAISNIKFKKVILYGSVLFIASSVINLFIQDFILFPQMLAFTIGSMVLIACIIMYFINLKSNQTLPNKHNLLLWISIGLLMFYSLYPYILYAGYFDYELYLKFHMRQIHHLLIALMYSCFILGFILMRRIRPTEEV